MINIKELLKENAPKIDKIIEKYIPREFTEKSAEFVFGKASYKYNLEALTKAVSVPVWDMLDRGGKRWRPALFMLIIEALGGEFEKFSDFVVIPEVIHNGTLMKDDIEDGSEERRGEKCTHIKFGIDIAVNAGDVMFFTPMIVLQKNKDKISNETSLKIYETFVNDMNCLGIGQGSDIAWHKGMANADNISEEEYLQMCANKTGCLARMSARIAAILAGGSEEQVEKIGKLAETIGVAFQIQDDILNLIESGVSKTKGGLGEDITEGKRTLMVIHTLGKAEDKDRERLIEILEMHTSEQEKREEAILILKKYDSINYSKEFARKMVKGAWKEVDAVFKESEAKEKLKVFADFLVERDI